jgi:hypothetical protein
MRHIFPQKKSFTIAFKTGTAINIINGVQNIHIIDVVINPFTTAVI